MDQDFDALPSEDDTVYFLIELGHNGVVNLLNDVVIDQMQQPWRTFVALINRSLSRKSTTLDKLCLSRAHILWGIPQMKETKVDKTYLGYATGIVPPKVARKFKKASPFKKDSVPVPTNKEHVHKAKRLKRSTKKSSTTPTTGIVISKPHVETQSKRKEKVDVARGKGIDLLSEVALTKEAQMKEVRKKSLRDFHKSHPSGSGSVNERPPSVEKITPLGNDDDDSNDEEGGEQENDSEEHELDSKQDTNRSKSDSESDQQDDDDDNDEVKDGDDEDDDNDDDQSESDEDRGMDSDDVPDKKLPRILPVEVSNFTLHVIEKMIQESLNQVNLRSREDKDKDKGPFARSDRGLKKQKTSKDAETTTRPKTKDSSSKSSKGTKSQPRSSGKSVHAVEPEFEVRDTNTPQGPAFRLLKGTLSNYVELEYDFEECYKALSEKLDWENPKGDDYPFDLSKPLPLITHGNHQSVPVEFFINNDLKYLQGGISTMTYTTFTTKTKAARYDLLGIKDMVPHIWSPVKVAYDKDALWEIMVRRADNKLYKFKEGDDVVDFAITLRMFTRSLVIQKREEDLQLRVESYQKQINVTKPDTTRPDLRKRHSYTPYKNLQGFIYVDDYQRKRLMRSDELDKFSDGTLTRFLSSLKDITMNIDMEYFPKRRLSTLKKKRAHYMIKDINKLLKKEG
nr:hypothetical protein [Tanacetum cinerariifolium]